MRSDYNISELRTPEIEQSLTAGQPLTAIINPSGELIVRSGSTIELGVTINNNGNQSALIDVYIDEASQPIHQWCVSSSERLGLGIGQSSEIIFQIQVPAETLPSTYNYTLVIDAPQNYPEDTPIFHKGRLTVLPFVQEAKTSTDPTFTLQPVTNSTAPIQIQPGETVELLALVHNRSNRVDLFRLVVTDLPNQWYRVIYTENFSQVGAIAAASGLELNPGEKGQIQILLTPPADAEAAVYAPTMRLYSVNNPDLVLLDVTYIQVLPIYLLDIQLLTLIGTVSNQSGVFELRLYNSGNTPRQLILNAKSADEKEHCTYQIEP
ncbi:MAG: transcriptional regulator, partial [Phormidium sp.]